jgi:RNA polymerase sigma factor (sigma-70 family)
MGLLDRGRKGARTADTSLMITPRDRFELLFRENSRPILGYALRRTSRPEDAADVLSEVMLIAWRRLDDVPAGAAARLWLFGVARRVVANQERAATRRLNLGERLRLEASRISGADPADGHEERETVRAALRRLPEGDRELLLLVAWEGLEPHEAAKVMAISRPAARTRLHRARRRLRRELTATGMNDDPDSQGRVEATPEPRFYPRIEEES